MPNDYHLPVFAKKFSKYLEDDLIGSLSTDKRIAIKIEGEHHTLSMKVYLHDTSFEDRILLGEYFSHYVSNKKIRQEFKSDFLPLGLIHLVYEVETEERKDNHLEIPFP